MDLKEYLCVKALVQEIKVIPGYLMHYAKDRAPEAEMELVYLKYEADKVIAELKESVKGLILDNYLKDKETRHNKYKRCLAMANWCDAKADWYYNIGESFRNRVEFNMKWRNRWLELAEKFKEAK